MTAAPPPARPSFVKRVGTGSVRAAARVSKILGSTLQQRKTSRKHRVLILSAIATIWTLGWFLISMTLELWQFQYWVPAGGIIAATAWAAIAILSQGRRKAGLRLAGTVSGAILVWTFLIWLPAVLFLFTSWLHFALWGAVLVGGLWIAALATPSWLVEMRPGEVYYYRANASHPDDFRLITPPCPEADEETLAALQKAGFSTDWLPRYIELGGPPDMRSAFQNMAAQKVKDGSRQEAQIQLDKLFEQLTAQSRLLEQVTWISPLDDIWLLWDKKQSVWINRDIEQLTTSDISTFNLKLEFCCSFDPKSILSPEFHLSLSKIRSVEGMTDVLKAVMGRGAEQAVRQIFVSLPYREALVESGIKKFIAALSQELDWARSFMGISLEAWSVRCVPEIPTSVREAQAARYISDVQTEALAKRETATLQALVDIARTQKVPPDLITRLQFLVQGGSQRLRYPPSEKVFDIPDEARTEWLFNTYAVERGQPLRLDAPVIPSEDKSSSAASGPQPDVKKPTDDEEDLYRLDLKDVLDTRPDDKGIYRVRPE